MGATGLRIESGFARFDARERQQIFGQARHACRILADDFKKLPRRTGILG